jgi:TPR repeat protein
MEFIEQTRKFRKKAFLYAIAYPISICAICFIVFIIAAIIAACSGSSPQNSKPPDWFFKSLLFSTVLIILSLGKGIYYCLKLLAILYERGRHEVSKRIGNRPAKEGDKAMGGELNARFQSNLAKNPTDSFNIPSTPSKNSQSRPADAAKSGQSADVQTNLGNKYYQGDGVKQDYHQALLCYLKAADQGDSSVYGIIGWIYQNGLGVAQDYSNALTWYHKAADQGDASAQYNIGWTYRNGLGVHIYILREQQRRCLKHYPAEPVGSGCPFHGNLVQ